MNLNEISLDIRQLLDSKRVDLGLEFEESGHIYTMKDINGVLRTDFPSVSKVLKLFYDEFPGDDIAHKKSGGNIREKNRLLKEWADAGIYSANMGSRVHYLLEKSLLSEYGNYKEIRKPDFECDIEQMTKGDAMVRAGTKFLKLMKDRGAVLLDTESVLGCNILGYTGAPDKIWLIQNKSGTGFGFIITDYKTNKPKNFEPNGFTGKMKHPFNFLDDTALGHYYLQLPMYGRLLLSMLKGTKYEDVKLYGSIIVLLKDDSTFMEYRVPPEVTNIIMSPNFSKYLTKS